MLQVIRGILKVSDPSDVPQSRLERYWREFDLDGSSTVDFEEFLIWMLGSGICGPSTVLVGDAFGIRWADKHRTILRCVLRFGFQII